MAKTYSLDEVLGSSVPSTVEKTYSLDQVLGDQPELPKVPGPTPGLVGFINQQPRASVLEGVELPQEQRPAPVRAEFIDALQANLNAMPEAQRTAKLQEFLQRPDVYGKAAQVIADRYEAMGKVVSPTQKKVTDLRLEPQTERFIEQGASAEVAENLARQQAMRGQLRPDLQQMRADIVGEQAAAEAERVAKEMEGAGFGKRVGAEAAGQARQAGLGLISMAADLAGDKEMQSRVAGASRIEKEMAGAIPKGEGIFEKSAQQAIASAAVQGPMTLLSIATGTPAPLLMQVGVQQLGSSYNEGRQAGLTPEMALARAVPMTAAEILFERFGMEKALAGLGKYMVQAGPKADVPKYFAEAVAKEIPSELATTLTQYGIDILPGVGLERNPSLVDLYKQLEETLRQTVIQAGATAGVTAPAAKIAQKIEERLPAPREGYREDLTIPGTAEAMARERGFFAEPVAPEAAAPQAATRAAPQAEDQTQKLLGLLQDLEATAGAKRPAEAPKPDDYVSLQRQKQRLEAETQTPEVRAELARVDEQIKDILVRAIEVHRRDAEAAKESVFAQEQLPPVESRAAVVAERDLAEMQAREPFPEPKKSEIRQQIEQAEKWAGRPEPITDVEMDLKETEESLRSLKAKNRGRPLVKALEGALDPREISDIGIDDRRLKGELMNKAGKGTFLSELVSSGSLDEFLEPSQRLDSPSRDVEKATQAIREKIESGDYSFYGIGSEIKKAEAKIDYLARSIGEPKRAEYEISEVEPGEAASIERTAGDAEVLELLPDLEGLRYQRTESIGKSIGKDQTQSIVDTVKSQWANAPEVVVAENMDDPSIPAEVRAHNKAAMQKGAKGSPRGFFYKGKAYVLADAATSPTQVMETLFHESLGHYGLRGTFGPEMESVLRDVVKNRRADVEAKAEQYGLDPKNESDMLEAAEEVLAEIAQTKPGLSFVKRAIAVIRNFLRKLGLPFEMSNDDIIQKYILPARAFVEKGGSKGVEGKPAAMREGRAPQTETDAFKRWFGDSKVVDENGKPRVMYHGTARDFSIFDRLKSTEFRRPSMDTVGSWFSSDPNKAAQYSGGEGLNVMPVYLSIKNPKLYRSFDDFLRDMHEAEGRKFEEQQPKGIGSAEGLRAKLKAEGYDGIQFEQTDNESLYQEIKQIQESIKRARDEEFSVKRADRAPYTMKRERLENTLRSMKAELDQMGGSTEFDGHDVFVALDPNQIKSATGNIGTFDPNTADIRYQREGEPEERAKEPKKLEDTWLLGRDKAGNVGFGPGAKAYATVANIANNVLDKVYLKPVSPELGRALRNMKVKVDQVQKKIGEVAAEMNKMSPDERVMISDIIEGELKAGVHPPQHVLNLAAAIQSMMSRQSQELVDLGMLSKEAANRWDNKYLPRFYERNLKNDVNAWAKAAREVFMKQPMMRGIKGSSLRARGLFEVIDTADLQDWVNQGWEQRDPNFDPKKSEKTIVWRDYTKQEREDMGEIRDAMFRFVMGYNASQRDIALGRLYRDLSKNYASDVPQDGYVQVPDSKAEGTFAPKYGELAGKYVPKEIMDHLSANDHAMAEGVLKIYRAGLSKWKEGKTVLNPVSHANNVLSNLTMAHFAGVSYWDAHKYAGAIKDFVKKDPMIKEADEVGLFGGSFNQSELVKSMPPELRAMANLTDSQLSRFGERIWDLFAYTVEVGGRKYGARPVMQWAYENEDMFFRYLIYRDARNRGMDPEDARDYSQEYIFTYDDLPKGARALRDYGMPFFSYTYKVVPVLARTALVYPWRYAVPATIAYTANALMYAMAANLGADEDDWWGKVLYKYVTDPEFRKRANEIEAEERKHLPEWLKGSSAILSTPKAIRMGMDEATNLPMFLDISRIFPGGDLLDANNNSGGVALLQPLTPSNPVLTTLVAMLPNKDMFLGKDVTKKTDTEEEKAMQRGEWLWKQVTPAISVGNYHFDRAMNVIANITGEPIEIDAGPMGFVSYTGIGKDKLPVQPKHAMLQMMGIKIRPYDLDLAKSIEESNRRKIIKDLDFEIRRINYQEASKQMTSKAASIEREKLIKKKVNIAQGLTLSGEEKD